METAELRRVVFKGIRRSNNNKSASYGAYIVNGWDDQKIDDVFGEDGTPVDELDKLTKRKQSGARMAAEEALLVS